MAIVSDRLDQIAAVLAELGAGDPVDLRRALREYDVRDIIAVLANNLAGGNGDTEAGMIVGRKFSFSYADFTVDMGSGAFASDVFYTLQPDEQLLFATARITELFDDSGPFSGALFVDSDSSAGFAGISLPTPDVPTATEGVVSLFGDNVGSRSWGEMTNAVEPDTAAVGMRMGSINWAADGSQGAVDATIYTCTPIPPA